MIHPTGTTDITHVVFILDASGSMDEIRSEAIEMFNGQMTAVRNAVAKAPNGHATVTLATFGIESRPIVHYLGQPVERLSRLSRANYEPDGMTPMMDAIGWTVERVEHELVNPATDYSVLVVIVTDGLENYSGKWQATVPPEQRHRAYAAEDIKEIITRHEATGRWTYVLMGADIDLKALAREIGLSDGADIRWQKKRRPMQAMGSQFEQATELFFMERRNEGARQSKGFWKGK